MSTFEHPVSNTESTITESIITEERTSATKQNTPLLYDNCWHPPLLTETQRDLFNLPRWKKPNVHTHNTKLKLLKKHWQYKNNWDDLLADARKVNAEEDNLLEQKKNQIR